MGIEILMRYLLILLIMACQCFGTTYFIDFTDGDNTKSGETEALAWKTMSMVRQATNVIATFAPDDIIKLQRGEEWPEAMRPETSGTAALPIIYTDYGTGALPIVNRRDTTPGWDDAAGEWTEDAANHWRWDAAGSDPGTATLGRIWINSVGLGALTEALRAENGDAMTSTYNYSHSDLAGTATGGDYLWIYNVGNPVDGAGGAALTDLQSSHGGGLNMALRLNNVNYITVQNIDFRGGIRGVSLTGTSAYAIIEDCVIGLYSQIGIFVEAGNSHIIRNNTISSGFPDIAYTHELANWALDGITFLKGDGLDIDSNTFLNWGHSALGVGPLSAVSVSNNKIHGNIISAPNCDYGRGFGVGGSAGTCNANEFYENEIFDTTIRQQVSGTNNLIYNNIIRDTTRTDVGGSWSDVDFFDFAQGIVIAASSVNATNCKIFNNTFANIAESGIAFKAGSGGHTATGNRVENNILYNCANDIDPGQAHDSSIYYTTDTNASDNIIRNNCIYQTGDTDVIEYRNDRVYITIGEFEAGVSDGDIASNNINANPKFIDATSNNFNLKFDSPCIDIGVNVNITSDFDRIARLGNPDLGAYEYKYTTFGGRRGEVNKTRKPFRGRRY